MKKLFLAILIALFPVVASAQTPCHSLDFVEKAIAETVTDVHGSMYAYDHVDSQVIMDYINNHVGEPTDYKADTVLLAIATDNKVGAVYLFIDSCELAYITISLDNAEAARKKVEASHS